MPVDRYVINQVCEQIGEVKGIDPIACKEATRCIRAAVKEILQSLNFSPSGEDLQQLIGLIQRSYNCAQVVDGTMLGSRAAESLSVGIAQTAQSLFKMVEKVINLDEAAKRATEIFNTVEDRSTQEIFLHLDRSQAKHKVPGNIWEGIRLPNTVDIKRVKNRSLCNFNLHEVTQAQSFFLRLTVADILKDGSIHNAVIGVMGEFEGDNLSKKVRKLREAAIEEGAPVLEPGLWNKIYALKSKRNLPTVYTLRLKLDCKLMYTYGITVEHVVKQINKSVTKDDRNKRVYAIGSNFSHEGSAIVDVVTPSSYIGEINAEMSENIFLFSHVVEMLDTIVVSGIRGVKESSVQKFKLTNLVKVFKPSRYFIGELGRERWLKGYGEWVDKYQEENFNNPIISYDTDLSSQIDSNIVTTTELKKTDFVLARQEGIYYCLSHEFDDSRYIVETDLLDELYIQKYCGKRDFDKLWYIKLDIMTMITECIDIDLIVAMFHYCGLEIVSLEKHRVCREYVGYIYVYSDEDPTKVLERHENVSYNNLFKPDGTCKVFEFVEGKAKSLGYFSDTAAEHIINLAGSDSWDSVMKTLDRLDLSSIFFYHTLLLKVDRKGADTKSGRSNLERYVLPHVYSKIITHPIVDRNKTVSNDWTLMNFVIGVEANKNNYAKEIRILFMNCDIKVDPRHISLYCEYAFEGSVPRGVGLSSLIEHDIGAFTEAISKQAVKRLYASTNLGPETLMSTPAAMVLSAPPMVGKDAARRYVSMLERQTQTFKYKEKLRLRYASSTYQVTGENELENGIIKALKALREEEDPYISIPKFVITEDLKNKVPQPPKDLEVVFSFKMPSLVESIKKCIGRRVKDLQSRKSYEKALMRMPERVFFYDADLIYDTATELLG